MLTEVFHRNQNDSYPLVDTVVFLFPHFKAHKSRAESSARRVTSIQFPCLLEFGIQTYI